MKRAKKIGNREKAKMKLTIFLVFWCSIASTNCLSPIFDNALELSGYMPQRPFKDAVYLVLNNWNRITPQMKQILPLFEYQTIDGSRPHLHFINVFFLLKDLYYSTNTTYRIEHVEYDGIAHKIMELNAVVERIDVLILPDGTVNPDEISSVIRDGLEMINRTEDLLNALRQFYVSSGDLSDDPWARQEDKRQQVNCDQLGDYMPEMNIKYAAYLPFVTTNRLLELRALLQPAEFDNIRSKLQITKRFYHFKFLHQTIDADFKISQADFDTIASKCESILQLHHAIIGIHITLSGYYSAYITERAEHIILLIDDIMYMLLELSPQFATNYEIMTSEFITEHSYWNNIVNSSLGTVLPNIVDFRRMTVNVASSIIKIGNAIQVLVNVRYTQMCLYLATGYQFAMGAFNMFAPFLNLFYFELHVPDDATLWKIQKYYDIILTNIATLNGTIEKIKTIAVKRPTFNNPEKRRMIMDLVTANHGVIADSFHIIINCLLPYLPNIDDTKRYQHSFFLTELREFKEQVLQEE